MKETISSRVPEGLKKKIEYLNEFQVFNTSSLSAFVRSAVLEAVNRKMEFLKSNGILDQERGLKFEP